ncbi:ATPase family protein associated with various cellular activities (AAA) [Archangium gephyra]|uniref:ATPase family protein associated with various cellular activities (AAA) n=1 Tax=Archangium gephyra TaxID=48 RepID=A0AAC8Q8K1_9BACT|nr:ATP-binding protein [Archangium gephyra]AKJ02885.1 ATPase, AAA family [Archangium gephyra]REG25011.1 ATPase family protein associated with various cellular activities (AAA) [Archangium gephyra]
MSEPFQHFKLYLFAAVSRVVAHAARMLGTEDALLARFPFLSGYREELEHLGLATLEAEDGAGAWPEAIATWEEDTPGHLPLRALREAAGLEHDALTLLLAVGLVEEDARFGLLFATLQGTPTLHRPNLGLLNAWWRPPEDRGEVRARLRGLERLGLVEIINPDAPRTEWALHVPGPLWDALRGEAHEHLAPGLRYHPLEQLQGEEPLILPEALRDTLARVPPLLQSGEAEALLVRGPRHNGRRTLLRTVARELGRGVLQVEGLGKAEDARWRMVGPLATLLHALPVVVLEPAPGETVELPPLEGSDAPLGVVLGRQGGVSGPGLERALTLHLPQPGPDERRRHWRSGLGPEECPALDTLTSRFRMTSGNIRRAARLARAHAALAGRKTVEPEDAQEASRALDRQTLDTLAVRLSPSGDWSQLAVGEETLRELRHLETRCRHREQLPARVSESLGRQLTPGVRALFQGTSGTGKTLAARLLAAALRMELYRVELSSVVNKYIGETEKNLGRLFSLAEELDVLLLFDEGDALFARRTGVGSSNDRYANLETNYLLQRIESYEGILLVTTNAPDAIDPAFQRRMDVVVDFRAPEPSERWVLWQLHLPAAHAVEAALLREVAARCNLSGGQIRNAVLHASLLALEDGATLGTEHLEAGVVREYRKAGAVCPLRRAGASSLRD